MHKPQPMDPLTLTKEIGQKLTVVSRRAQKDREGHFKGMGGTLCQSSPSRLESEHPPECTVKTFRVPSILCADPMTCNQHLAPSKAQSVSVRGDAQYLSASSLCTSIQTICISHDVLLKKNDRSSEALTSIDHNSSLICAVRTDYALSSNGLICGYSMTPAMCAPLGKRRLKTCPRGRAPQKSAHAASASMLAPWCRPQK